MPSAVSFRAQEIVQAEIRAMTLECERVGGINLAQGVCDTGVPLPIRQAAHSAIDMGINSYTRFDGLRELREAIARKLYRDNGIQADPETEITVSAGSTGAFYCACLALLNPGDHVILFEPYYGYHLNTLLAVGAVPLYVPLQPTDWKFAPETLECAAAQARAIVVNTPANPSGKVFSRAELEAIAEIADHFNLIVFTDEIYEYFVYDGHQHVSPAVLPGMAERTVTISGFSKVFSITGWRIGYSVAKPDWAQMIGYINDLVYVCAPAPLQYGVAEGLAELGPEFYKELARQYAYRRDRLCQTLRQVGLVPYVPQGAYYVLADGTRLPGVTGKERAMALLAQTGVASVPGSAFWHDDTGHRFLRFCFAKADDELEEACQRLARLA